MVPRGQVLSYGKKGKHGGMAPARPGAHPMGGFEGTPVPLPFSERGYLRVLGCLPLHIRPVPVTPAAQRPTPAAANLDGVGDR